MYRGGYKHVARGAGLLALLCAALVNVSCDALGNVKFPGDFVAGLEEARTTKITFYDKNPIENPNAKSAFRRYKFEYEFNINTEYPEELCPGGIPEEWKYIDFENLSAPPPVNVSVDSNGKIQTVYVTQRELCFYVSSWHTHSFAAEWESDDTHHWHTATCGHDVTGGLAAHDWKVEVIVDATQEDDGEEKRTCNVCGKTKIVVIPALGHVHTFDTTTWEKDATHHWHPATCRHTDVKGDLAAHVWGNETIITPASCTTDGEKTYTCLCGATKTETIAATGHTFDTTTWKSDDTRHWHAATCEHTTEKKDEAEHSWNSNDTCSVCGKVKSTCVEFDDSRGLKEKLIEYLSDPSRADTTPKIKVKANSNTYISIIKDALTNDAVTSNVAGVDLVLTTDSLTSLPQDAFRGCSVLTSVEIPSGVKSIGQSAFSGCSALTSVTIPDSVIYIGNAAFSGCSALTTLEIPSSVTYIEQAAFMNCSALTSVKIPANCTTIGMQAFQGCRGLTSVEIQSGVISIWAFSGCSGLKSVVIGDNVTSIGDSAFGSCSALTSVVIGNSVTTIGDSAFYGCSGLTSVTIPASVTSIGRWAFNDCSSLNSVEFVDKNGWYADNSSSLNYSGSELNVGDANANATKLKTGGAWVGKYLHKKPTTP